jgi:hypothetical protein
MLVFYGRLFKIFCTLYIHIEMLLITTQKNRYFETNDRSLNHNLPINFTQCRKTDQHKLKTQQFIATVTCTFIILYLLWVQLKNLISQHCGHINMGMSGHTPLPHYLMGINCQTPVLYKYMCVCVCVSVCVFQTAQC